MLDGVYSSCIHARMAIQNRLRELREARGLTQVDVAEKLGVSQAHVSRVESGYEKPRSAARWQICRALGLRSSPTCGPRAPASPGAVALEHDATSAPDAAVA